MRWSRLTAEQAFPQKCVLKMEFILKIVSVPCSCVKMWSSLLCGWISVWMCYTYTFYECKSCSCITWMANDLAIPLLVSFQVEKQA